MRDLLVDAGVPLDAILPDDGGTSTRGPSIQPGTSAHCAAGET